MWIEREVWAVSLAAFGVLAEMLTNPERTRQAIADMSDTLTAGIRALAQP